MTAGRNGCGCGVDRRGFEIHAPQQRSRGVGFSIGVR